MTALIGIMFPPVWFGPKYDSGRNLGPDGVHPDLQCYSQFASLVKKNLT